MGFDGPAPLALSLLMQHPAGCPEELHWRKKRREGVGGERQEDHCEVLAEARLQKRVF